jgi:hypothetical protein
LQEADHFVVKGRPGRAFGPEIDAMSLKKALKHFFVANAVKYTHKRCKLSQYLIHSSIATLSLKTLYPGGIRNWVFYS